MKQIQKPRKKAPSVKKGKVIDWIVAVKDDSINAARNNYVNTKANVIKAGYKVIGECAFAKKIDAIEYIEAITGKYYKRERKKK